jgi:hypothetical protein
MIYKFTPLILNNNIHTTNNSLEKNPILIAKIIHTQIVKIITNTVFKELRKFRINNQSQPHV